MNLFPYFFAQTMEGQIYVDIAKVASIYRGLRPQKRFFQM